MAPLKPEEVTNLPNSRFVKEGSIFWKEFEEFCISVIGEDKELTQRLAYEDLLWHLLKQLWANHWELNVNIVCWLDAAPDQTQVDLVLRISRSLWLTLRHLRQIVTDDIMINAMMINDRVKERAPKSKEMLSQLIALTPAYQGPRDIDAADLYTTLPAFWQTDDSLFEPSKLDFYTMVLEIHANVNVMVRNSAAEERSNTWKDCQKYFKYNDSVTASLLETPFKTLKDLSGGTISEGTVLDQMAAVSPTLKRETSALDASNIWSHLTGPVWLCAAAHTERIEGCIGLLVAQCLALCAHSDGDLQRAADLADKSQGGSLEALTNFLSEDGRPTLARSAHSASRPPFLLRLLESDWTKWLGQFGELFSDVVSSNFTSHQAKTEFGRYMSTTSNDDVPLDTAEIRSMLFSTIDEDYGSPPIIQPFDKEQSRCWLTKLHALQDWIYLKGTLAFKENNMQRRDELFLAVSDKLPVSIASDLLKLSKFNPNLTKAIGFSVSAATSIACRAYMPAKDVYQYHGEDLPIDLSQIQFRKTVKEKTGGENASEVEQKPFVQQKTFDIPQTRSVSTVQAETPNLAFSDILRLTRSSTRKSSQDLSSIREQEETVTPPSPIADRTTTIESYFHKEPHRQGESDIKETEAKHWQFARKIRKLCEPILSATGSGSSDLASKPQVEAKPSLSAQTTQSATRPNEVDPRVTDRLISLLEELKTCIKRLNTDAAPAMSPADPTASAYDDSLIRPASDWMHRQSVGPKFTCYSLPVTNHRASSPRLPPFVQMSSMTSPALHAYYNRPINCGPVYTPDYPFRHGVPVSQDPPEVYYEPLGDPIIAQREYFPKTNE